MARILPHKFEHDKFFSTQELIQFLAGHRRPDEIFHIECNLTSGSFNCTHYIAYVDETTLIDIGIDDKEIEYTHDEFIKAYPKATWRIADCTLKSLEITA